ncbi:MAG: isoleucine--tRNA ligase [Phycisphaerales bacterium]|jgi:isoleucyl-tRNA synthetase|nr:isoleucine--tRNA ligase [Phycisphaerales bacterium]
MTQTTPNYKKTLNLPQTTFPMRGNLAQNEPQSVKRWEKADLYKEIQESCKDAEPFVFHDGPPYANGSIHVGHLLNKVLKDFVVRTQLMLGKQCLFTPGWDCHGLPIEHKVMTNLVETGKIEKLKELDDDVRRIAIRRECKKYAEKYVKLQTKQMKNLLTLADYDDPYLTMNPKYEAAVLEVFANLVETGLVYRQLKPVHWSIANETALAEAELEYYEREDPSIFVYFDAVDKDTVATAFGVSLDEVPSFLIWTTTPWTLVANMAITVSPRFEYSLVRLGDKVTVVASELLKKVAGITNVTAEVLGTCKGDALVGMSYDHVYCDRTCPIISGDHVTLEDGTGLVHTAPGHGTDDYMVGLANNLDIYCPVQADGVYDDTVPEFLSGLSVWDANDVVVNKLKETNHLYHLSLYTHSYPHDWRSKTPVIFRSTEQWFVAVDGKLDSGKSLRDSALEATENNIRFVPAWGQNRLRGMIESRPDWCLSRQRSWGLPIPAFVQSDGSVLLTPETVRAVAKVFEEHGSDSWFSQPPEVLLTHWENPDNVDLTKLEKMHDIFDVWFESGTSWYAVMEQRGQGYPMDLYLEGSDQHRGWFQLSMLPALATTGQSPFKTVLTHGFMVDKNGHKMSKSGGNALDVDDLLKDFGADVCRWWVSSLSYENDIKVDMSFFEIAGESYRKVRNTLRFLLGNVSDNVDEEISPTSIDGWVLGELSKMSNKVQDALSKYEFRSAHQALYDFCNETLSSIYLTAVKDRLYCDPVDSPRRMLTTSTMRLISDKLIRLLAPFMPHTAGEAWIALNGEQSESVHKQTFSSTEYVLDEKWIEVMQVRDRALKELEESKKRGIDNPLDAGLVLPDSVSWLDSSDYADLCGVSRVSYGSDLVQVTDLRSEPMCERSWKRDRTVRERSDGGMLSDRDAKAVGVE